VFGATWAGPIGAFIMEKYLNDTIAADRLSEVERISKADLIPSAIKDWYVKKENQRQAKLIIEAEAAKAEMNSESKQNNIDEEDNSEKIPIGTEKNKEQLEMILPDNKNIKPVLPQNKKDSSKKKNTNTTTALLIDETKKWFVKKTKA